ncbi:hypothetical protein N7471_005473 [Penicillium samsonianum]|uniref:uncharacterized protein n=1 Tax=Penicillium samsonianum TaxID=1882272 RepID=UPI002548FA27|nr:uncharacterized protein N7471_005473 [Penicillium samsonianum]KAJ6138987.1 hypothetical protein N7471_005473 [Penicillium samsonianum]
MNPFVGAIKKDQSTRMWHQNVVSIPLALTVIGPLTERDGEMVGGKLAEVASFAYHEQAIHTTLSQLSST